MANTNRNYRDSVFTSFFSDAEKLIETYNAIAGSDYPKDTDIEINTLEDALYMNRINDLSFLLDGKLVILIEHQSILNENIPLRMLLYIGRVYEKIIENRSIYRRKLIKIPRPEFIVLYNGDAEYPDRGTLRLSDAFAEADVHGMPELTVKVYNINHGRNPGILQRSRSLGEYAVFIARVKANTADGMPFAEAVREAISYCIKNGIMKEFLEKQGSEVENMLFTEFNMDDALQVRFEEGIEEGIEKGIEKTAKAALAKGFSVSDVAEITGLDLNTVEKLRAGTLQ